MNYNDFKNKISTLLIENNYISNPSILLNFLAKLYTQLAWNNFNIDSLDQLFHLIKDSLKNEDSTISITISDIWNLFNARKHFRDLFQEKEFTNIAWSNLLEAILFLQISELIVGIDNWFNFDKWENLSIHKYIEAWVSGLIDSQSSEADKITPMLVCAFIEFWKNYE